MALPKSALNDLRSAIRAGGDIDVLRQACIGGDQAALGSRGAIAPSDDNGTRQALPRTDAL
jgi:hypothetical protein